MMKLHAKRFLRRLSELTQLEILKPSNRLICLLAFSPGQICVHVDFKFRACSKVKYRARENRNPASLSVLPARGTLPRNVLHAITATTSFLPKVGDKVENEMRAGKKKKRKQTRTGVVSGMNEL